MDFSSFGEWALATFPFLPDLVSPLYSWAHFPYALLVVSMLMRNIVWLRAIAIFAGVSRILIRSMILYDPVTVAWETALVLINVGQLLLIWWDRGQSHANEDEALLATTVLPGQPGRASRKLLKLAQWRQVEPGETLISEGQRIDHLLFVTDGAARIEKHGALVAICSRGDFVGEMGFVSGNPATATVIADRPMRLASFDSATLKASLADHPDLRHALEASFNRNLIGKLSRANAGPAATA
ncbi:MAG: cyclic nucleotide-binding domain-containing protein [Hyphomicrobiales bacterium]|nr:MAG: cyclic nucleotide-binding domain-containing protein [Hyphomicrobiales bacterium]